MPVRNLGGGGMLRKHLYIRLRPQVGNSHRLSRYCSPAARSSIWHKARHRKSIPTARARHTTRHTDSKEFGEAAYGSYDGSQAATLANSAVTKGAKIQLLALARASRLFIIGLAVGLSGCATVSVNKVDHTTGKVVDGAAEGLRFYLPRPY